MSNEIPDLDIYEPPERMQARDRQRAREIIHSVMLERDAALIRCVTLETAIEKMRVAGGKEEFQIAFDRAKALIAPPVEDDEL